jgi:hypothetical protein
MTDTNTTNSNIDNTDVVTHTLDSCNNENKVPPKMVFIIPYRDRKEHKVFFTLYMKHILEDIPKIDYELYFVEQKNTLPFNRGGMKNIGFLAIKYKYPNDYKNITFIFNDIDTVPYTKNIINYETDHGIVKHFYGFSFALGGIFSIKGGDFEVTNGFPNFWAWGGEDNYMQKRVEYAGLTIDRSCFFKILDKNIIQLCDGIKRLICRKEIANAVNMTTIDGLVTIRNVNYHFKDEYINVYHFETSVNPRTLNFEEQNIANETKVRLEKQDIKSDLERQYNSGQNYINHQRILLKQMINPINAPVPGMQYSQIQQQRPPQMQQQQQQHHQRPPQMQQQQHQQRPPQMQQQQQHHQRPPQMQQQQHHQRPPQMRQRYGNRFF